MLVFSNCCLQQPWRERRACRKLCSTVAVNATNHGCAPANELHALVCDVARLRKIDPAACGAFLRDDAMVAAVRAISSANICDLAHLEGGLQGMPVLCQLVDAHINPAQQSVLTAAVNAAAKASRQLSPQQELNLLLEQPLVKTALQRMSRDPQLCMSSYGQDHRVLRSVMLLEKALEEDQVANHLVEVLLSAQQSEQGQQHAKTHHFKYLQNKGLGQQQHKRLQQQQQNPTTPVHCSNEPAQQQQQPQQQRQLVRAAVIARSTTHTNLRMSSSSKKPNSHPGGFGAAAKT